MLKRAVYLGTIAVAAWQLFNAVKGYRKASRKRTEREDINRWEGEGGNPIPAPQQQRPRAYP